MECWGLQLAFNVGKITHFLTSIQRLNITLKPCHISTWIQFNKIECIFNVEVRHCFNVFLKLLFQHLKSITLFQRWKLVVQRSDLKPTLKQRCVSVWFLLRFAIKFAISTFSLVRWWAVAFRWFQIWYRHYWGVLYQSDHMGLNVCMLYVHSTSMKTLYRTSTASQDLY